MSDIKKLFVRNRTQSNKNWFARCRELFYSERTLIGSLARDQRKAAGLSVKEVAEKMNIPTLFLSEFESGSIAFGDKEFDKWEEAVFPGKKKKKKKTD